MSAYGGAVKVAFSAGAAVAKPYFHCRFVFFFMLTAAGCGPSADVRSLAAQMRASVPSGSFDLRKLGDKVCIVPEGTFPTLTVMRLFPDFEVRYNGPFRSEGYWYVLIGNHRAMQVKVLDVPQQYIHWDVPEYVVLERLVACDVAIPVRVLNDGRLSIEPPVPGR